MASYALLDQAEEGRHTPVSLSSMKLTYFRYPSQVSPPQRRRKALQKDHQTTAVRQFTHLNTSNPSPYATT